MTPGNVLPEITVLHVYRGPNKAESPGPKALVGFFYHPNPDALADKLTELRGSPENWHVDSVRYVLAEHQAIPGNDQRVELLQTDEGCVSVLIGRKP